jgi:hypothetical protein
MGRAWLPPSVADIEEPRETVWQAARPLVRHRLRNLVAAFVIVVAMVGMVLMLTIQGTSPPGASTRPAPRSTVASHIARASTSHLSLTPPLIRPQPFPLQALTAPKR